MKKITLLLITTAIVYNTNAQAALDEGLLLYLPFNGNTDDASGNDNDAINYGATLTADASGNPNSAYYFDGEDDYMKIPLVPMFATLPDSMTLAVKVKPHSFYSGVCHVNMIINTGLRDDDPSTYTLHYTSNSYYPNDCYTYDTIHQNYRYGYAGTPFDPDEMSTEPFIKADEWDCVVYTFNGFKHRMYVNGDLRYELENEQPYPAPPANDVFLGAKNHADYPYWMNATLDEVRIYNRTLNEDEIAAYCKGGQQPSSLKKVRIEKLPVLQNPVEDMLQLGLQSTDLNGIFKITDLSGRTMIDISRLQSGTVPVDHLTPGMYIVSYQVKDKFLRAKIVKK